LKLVTFACSCDDAAGVPVGEGVAVGEGVVAAAGVPVGEGVAEAVEDDEPQEVRALVTASASTNRSIEVRKICGEDNRPL
jgi:hypothetical protein